MNDASEDRSTDSVDTARTTGSPSTEQDLNQTWAEVDAVLSQATQTQSASSSGGQPAEAKRTIDPSSPLIMVETAFLASAAGLLWLVNYYFPIGPLWRIFFPIPIALIYLRWNSRSAWMGALISGLLLSVLMGPVRSIQYVMPFGFMGVLLGVLWRRKAQWAVSIGLGALLGAIGIFFRLSLLSVLLGDDLWLYATTQVTGFLEWLFVRLGLLIQPSLAMVQAAIVVMILLNNVIYLFVVHLVALFLLDRLGNPIPRPPRWVLVLLEYEDG